MTIKIGSLVEWNCIEGFGGRAIVIAQRDPRMASQWKVRMLDGSQPDTWALDGELTEVVMSRDDVIRSTAEHIRRVGELLCDCASELTHRAVQHDSSKWSDKEWPLFADSTPKLAALTYGSDEYKAALESIKPALKHHYAKNSHHPEHHANGVDDMTLLDLLEMLCDWKAATERHHDGSIANSLELNQGRFLIGEQLMHILRNTAIARGWITPASAAGGEA